MFGEYAMSCHLDDLDLVELVMFGLVKLREGALNRFEVELVHKRLLDIWHLRGLVATYPKHVFNVDSSIQMIPNWSEKLHNT